MKKQKMESIAVDKLVERFLAIALEQDEALLMDEISKYNRLFREMEAIESELKARPGDQRRALVQFYNHSNAQVRLKAALATLAVDPAGSRQTLQIISDRNEYPEAANARGMLSALAEGRYVPT